MAIRHANPRQSPPIPHQSPSKCRANPVPIPSIKLPQDTSSNRFRRGSHEHDRACDTEDNEADDGDGDADDHDVDDDDDRDDDADDGGDDDSD